MRRRDLHNPVCRLVIAIAAMSPFGAQGSAQAATFATSYVTAHHAAGLEGQDASVDVREAISVRITASGSITSPFKSCGTSLQPSGCNSAFSFARDAANAPTGALLLAFADRNDRRLSAWVEVGNAAYVSVPQGAVRVLLRINGVTELETGRYRVVTDVISSSGPSASTSSVRRALSSARLVASGLPTTRADIQYVLRRLGFGASPEDVTAVAQIGIPAWLQAQLSPSTVDDSAAATEVEPIQFVTGNSTTDAGWPGVIFRRIIQREAASKRQVLEKLTLHWLEHFSINENKVYSPGAMAHYEDTVRSDALGNFATLVSDVSKEPAMLLWLDNNYNSGSSPSTPPNENFARELMQLYVMGINELNPDGSPLLDSNGVPVPAYSETDVREVATALTGFQAYIPYPTPTGDPRTFEIESFNLQAHGKGPYNIIGHSVPDPGDPTVVDAVIGSLARNPSTAPFQSKELLQRLVTEDPSPGYISRVSAVWSATENDPNQIAKVVAAMVADREFMAGRNSMIKEPIEFGVDAVRGVGGAGSNPFTSSDPSPLDSLMAAENSMGENAYFAPTVFGFYRPGDKDALLNNSFILNRWNFAGVLSNDVRITTSCSTCDINLDFSAYSKATGPVIADRILDGLVDGGNPELRALVENYLAGSPANIPGALWIVLTSPEYEVN